MMLNENNYGYYRVSAVVPSLRVADIDYNVGQIIETCKNAVSQGAQLVVFPELSITGYTCGDLLANTLLLDKAEEALRQLTAVIELHHSIVIVGVPLRRDGLLFNCAVAIYNGEVIAVFPKTYIPNYKEFYEKRWMTSAHVLRQFATEINIGGKMVPFGTDIIINHGMAKIAVDICEDLWAPIPPSSFSAVNGANIIVNLSASNEVVGKHEFLDNLILHQASQSICGYVYSSSGYGESTTDLVFAGKGIIAENGTLLRESERFTRQSKTIIADVDLELIEHERRVNTTFADSSLLHKKDFRHISCLLLTKPLDYDTNEILHPIVSLPFVPQNVEKQQNRCEEIINIQTFGLIKRLEHTGVKKLVVGVSGGLDSTLALLIAVRAFEELGLDKKNIFGVTMPGFGTSGRTHSNAVKMMRALGVTYKEIPIGDAVIQHFKDIDHDINLHNVTYENSQARERTQILMDLSNKLSALVLGTGDLSELALGWATYNGDHMSMYNVNCSIPKTLAQHLVRWFANNKEYSTEISKILLDVLDTPISPELTPVDNSGSIAQKTEELIGPYELHDFFLFNILRYGFSPRKIYRLARQAFKDQFDNATIKKWLTTFIRRFFSQQFKRSCLPDGPKVGTVSLSPRGDWRMPSDAVAQLWLSECDKINV